VVQRYQEPPGEGLLWKLGGFVRTVRPHQWVKNVFVLAPIFFARDIANKELLFRAAGSFGVFCLLAGAVYTINDIADADADKLHPVKRFRPIASGRVSPGAAKIFSVLLVVLALGGAAYAESPFFLLIAASYFAMNLAYSFKLKHVAYLDVAIIATGFVLRVVGGGVGTQVHISYYIIICTALLALFLGFGKRRHEIAAVSRSKKQRAALSGYSAKGLDLALFITGIATVGTYFAYTIDPDTAAYFRSDKLWWTTLFVVLAVLRFLHLVRSRPHAESPTQEMLRDGPFVMAVLCWVGVVVWIVYNLRPA
jgi:4-hydroxybenzoate polyprenyltransferase